MGHFLVLQETLFSWKPMDRPSVSCQQESDAAVSPSAVNSRQSLLHLVPRMANRMKGKRNRNVGQTSCSSRGIISSFDCKLSFRVFTCFLLAFHSRLRVISSHFVFVISSLHLYLVAQLQSICCLGPILSCQVFALLSLFAVSLCSVMMKVSIEDFLKTELNFSAGTQSVVDSDPSSFLGLLPNNSSKIMDDEATTSGLNFHDNVLFRDILFNDNDSRGFEAIVTAGDGELFGENSYDPMKTNQQGSEADDDADEEQLTGRVKDDGNDLFRQSNSIMDDSSNRDMNHNWSDHDYNRTGDDDGVDSGINSSPVKVTGDAKIASSTGKPSSLRSGLRPRASAAGLTRKRCLSTSSFTSGESIDDDEDEDEVEVTPKKRQRLSSGQSMTSSTSRSTGRTGKQAGQRDASRGSSNSKNAIAARENREKKKMYIQGLEDKVARLETENKRIKSANDVKDKSIESLTQEVSYLRGILSNVDEISALIHSVRRTPGIQTVSTSLGSNLRRNGNNGRRGNNNNHMDNENVRPPLSSSTSSISLSGKQAFNPSASSSSSTSSGVCLHVLNGNVSLEFCAQCSRSAKRGGIKWIRNDIEWFTSGLIDSTLEARMNEENHIPFEGIFSSENLLRTQRTFLIFLSSFLNLCHLLLVIRQFACFQHFDQRH